MKIETERLIITEFSMDMAESVILEVILAQKYVLK